MIWIWSAWPFLFMMNACVCCKKSKKIYYHIREKRKKSGIRCALGTCKSGERWIKLLQYTHSNFSQALKFECFSSSWSTLESVLNQSCYSIVQLGCGRTTMENCTYLILSSTTPITMTNCLYTICKCNSNICRIRLEFKVSVFCHSSKG